MRVSVIINSKAGSVNPALIIDKVSEALFRCDLHFSNPNNISELEAFVKSEIGAITDAFMVCGGDGTINICLQTILRFQNENKIPIAIIKSGTANDLAHTLGVHRKIEVAARSILEGQIRFIDVIEVISGDSKNVMISNGGIGIPAEAAESANNLREAIRNLIKTNYSKKPIKYLLINLQNFVRQSGPTIYSLMAVNAILNWNSKNWEFEVKLDNGKTIVTRSPVIMINNQPTIGAHFFPAPFTSNSDGFINVLIAKKSSLLGLVRTLLKIKSGSILDKEYFESFETPSLKIKSINHSRSFNFFGDGEILVKKSDSLEIRCLKQAVPIFLHPETRP
jgi:diacylglycerol kinase family enzyme